MTGGQAYKELITFLFEKEENPTYELCQPTLINMFGEEIVFDMITRGLITYVGLNHNEIRVYKIR